jgi:hypothetical protein
MSKWNPGEYRFLESEEAKNWERAGFDLTHTTAASLMDQRVTIDFSIDSKYEGGRLLKITNESGVDLRFRVDAYYMPDELVDTIFECPDGETVEIDTPGNSRLALFWQQAEKA